MMMGVLIIRSDAKIAQRGKLRDKTSEIANAKETSPARAGKPDSIFGMTGTIN